MEQEEGTRRIGEVHPTLRQLSRKAALRRATKSTGCRVAATLLPWEQVTGGSSPPIPTIQVRSWRNGRRARSRAWWPRGRRGSSPLGRTIHLLGRAALIPRSDHRRSSSGACWLHCGVDWNGIQRRAHNPHQVGSTPTTATNCAAGGMADAPGSEPGEAQASWRFESSAAHQPSSPRRRRMGRRTLPIRGVASHG